MFYMNMMSTFRYSNIFHIMLCPQIPRQMFLSLCTSATQSTKTNILTVNRSKCSRSSRCYCSHGLLPFYIPQCLENIEANPRKPPTALSQLSVALQQVAPVSLVRAALGKARERVKRLIKERRKTRDGESRRMKRRRRREQCALKGQMVTAAK